MFWINIDEKQSKRTQWVSLFIDRHITVYFDSFRIEYIPQEALSKIKYISIINNIFRMQDDDSIMRGFYCIAFIKYMISGKTQVQIKKQMKREITF